MGAHWPPSTEKLWTASMQFGEEEEGVYILSSHTGPIKMMILKTNNSYDKRYFDFKNIVCITVYIANARREYIESEYALDMLC